MPEDRFGKHVTFPSGVRWEPTDHKPMDQTPYLEYLEKEEEKVRKYQVELAKGDIWGDGSGQIY